MNRKSVMLLIVILGVVGWVSFYQVSKVNAVVWIGGHITSDTAWTPVDTYRVINDTYVDPGVTLTILPGVNVQLADGFSLIVQGNLNATGTDANPIVFTSSRVTPSAGAWNTIDFSGTSNCSFTLEHARVEFALNGITLESQGYTMIARSEFFNCSESGIMIKGVANVAIVENTIEYNKNGIASGSTTQGIIIAGNVISSNMESGIHLDGHDSVCNVTIVSNTVSSNKQNGIYVYSSDTVWNVTFVSNTVSSNTQYGIYLDGLFNIWNVTFVSNTISSNKQNGIHLDGHDSVCNVTFVSNTVLSNAENGIYIYSQYSICNVTFVSNTVSSNTQYGIYLLNYFHVYNVAFVSNTVSSNTHNGIYLTGTSVWNVTFVSNTVLSNAENGIYVYNSFRIWNVTFVSNTVSSNKQNGIYFDGGHEPSVDYDLIASNNRVAENAQKGMYFADSIRSNVTGNSISYNQYGVFYESTTGNLAKWNDIYSNTYGMNVTSGATVNAEYNYWGDSSGPYHPSENPEGKGNPVNGNGVDLNFIPFLTSPQGHINEPPVAVLKVDKTTCGLNETVTFDASNSTDDGRIDYYFFDFGDGTNSSWTPLPVATHKYSAQGSYNVTLIAMDDFGVTSPSSSQSFTPVIVVPEFPSMIILPLFMVTTLISLVIYKRRICKTAP